MIQENESSRRVFSPSLLDQVIELYWIRGVASKSRILDESRSSRRNGTTRNEVISRSRVGVGGRAIGALSIHRAPTRSMEESGGVESSSLRTRTSVDRFGIRHFVDRFTDFQNY